MQSTDSVEFGPNLVEPGLISTEPGGVRPKFGEIGPPASTGFDLFRPEVRPKSSQLRTKSGDRFCPPALPN